MKSPLFANAQDTLKKYWGHNQFRSNQIPVIEQVLQKKDTLAILPTGAGKSICFQVPALCLDGMCLVVTPLIALMNDQVSTLRKKGINAHAIHSGMQLSDIESVWNQCKLGWVSFLYISPEQAQSENFLEQIRTTPPALIAIDEAHCISQWGFDFRPSYLKIKTLRIRFPQAPLVALTATATKKVEKDIVNYLLLRDPSILRSDTVRKNLSFQVKKAISPHTNIAAYLEQHSNHNTIIYAQTRKETKALSELLNKNGHNTSYYHAGLSNKERTSRERAFLSGEITSIVATSAFGMGIDKPDVDAVLHTHVPDSIENYYQQAGRAGRNEKPASCILYYNEHMLNSLEKNVARQFPPVDLIDTLYKHLIKYCYNSPNLDIRHGQEVCQLDVTAFAKEKNTPLYVLQQALKHLEQQELIHLEVPSKQNTKCHFIVTLDIVKQHLLLHPQQEKIVMHLIRTVPGILTDNVTIQPTHIAEVCAVGEMQVHKILTSLAQHGLMSYASGTMNSIIKLLQPQIRFDKALYENFKKIKLQNIQHIIRYVIESRDCRQHIFSTYFSSKKTTTCDSCDNCLQRKTSKKVQDKAILHYIKNALQEAPQKIDYLLQNAPTSFPQKKVLHKITQLEAEAIITLKPDSLKLEWKK